MVVLLIPWINTAYLTELILSEYTRLLAWNLHSMHIVLEVASHKILHFTMEI